MSRKAIVTQNFYKEVKTILADARRRSFRAVNFLMVEAYWNIGRMIVEEEFKWKKRAGYGEFLIKELAVKLTKDFGKGFTETNVRYFRLFFLAFPIHHALRDEFIKEESSKLHRLSRESASSKKAIHHAVRDEFIKEKSLTLYPIGRKSSNPIKHVSSSKSLTGKKMDAVRSGFVIQEAVNRKSGELKNYLRPELSWTHYRLLLKLDREEARLFYMNEAANSNWSTRELDRQITSLLFERLSLSKNKKAVIRMARKGQHIQEPGDLIKDPYVFEFLGLGNMEKYYEEDLEKALIDHLQKFLLELGKGFSFVARQKRITLENDHYHIDLVFYNRLTRSHILFDLKVGKLTHQDIGQMQMYVNYFNRNQKMKDENDTIGVILCAEKNNAVIKYTLPEKQKQIFISKYVPYLPTEKELKKEILREKEVFDMEHKLLPVKK